MGTQNDNVPTCETSNNRVRS